MYSPPHGALPALIIIKYPSRVWCPEQPPDGILLGGSTILGMLSSEQVELAEHLGAQVLDASACFVMPGLVDMHVHVTGGGGEAGPASRTPESSLSAFLDAGITTVVGVMGTDCYTRRPDNLVAKCRALNEEGITAYHWAGSYRVPLATVTGSVQQDMCVIESCIGVGEVAISDHRSSCPTPHELARIASEARVGGMLSGKAGLVHIHTGAGPSHLQPLLDACDLSDVPITQFLPTHMERNKSLVAAGVDWMKKGGFCDFTAGAEGREAVKELADHAATANLLRRCSVSSDSFGSLPVFDRSGKLLEYKVADPKELLRMLQQLHFEDGLVLADVIPLFTSQPAARLKLPQKGTIAVGKDADLLLLDKDSLELQYVFAKGKLVRTPEWTLGGAFERGPRIRPRPL